MSAIATVRRWASGCSRRCDCRMPRTFGCEVAEVLARFGLPVSLDASVDVDAVLEAVGRDKKRTAEGVGFVLLAEPGEPRTGQIIDPARVREAVEELRR